MCLFKLSLQELNFLFINNNEKLATTHFFLDVFTHVHIEAMVLTDASKEHTVDAFFILVKEKGIPCMTKISTNMIMGGGGGGGETCQQSKGLIN